MYGIHTEKQIVKIYGSLITAMLVGRIVSGILKALIFNVGEYSFKIFITSSFLTGIPGILIQLIFYSGHCAGITESRGLQSRKGDSYHGYQNIF